MAQRKAAALKTKRVKSCEKVFGPSFFGGGWALFFLFFCRRFIMPKHNHLLVTGGGGCGGASERLINLTRVDHLSASCIASYIANAKVSLSKLSSLLYLSVARVSLYFE